MPNAVVRSYVDADLAKNSSAVYFDKRFQQQQKTSSLSRFSKSSSIHKFSDKQ